MRFHLYVFAFEVMGGHLTAFSWEREIAIGSKNASANNQYLHQYNVDGESHKKWQSSTERRKQLYEYPKKHNYTFKKTRETRELDHR